MINKTDKFNIVLVIIIIIIIGLCLFSKIDNFINGRLKLEISSNELNRNFLARSVFDNEDNLFFIANMDYNDSKHLYFINHNLGVEKLRIKDTKIEETIPKIVFKIKFSNDKNIFTAQKIDLKADGDTVPEGTDIDLLKDIKYIPYRFIANQAIKINNGVKYFMINKFSEDIKMLERKNDKFQYEKITSLNEKHRHIFFLIPYYCESRIKTTNLTQGKKCIWRNFR